jgi:hydrogenase-4 membrane subunit HyfE
MSLSSWILVLAGAALIVDSRTARVLVAYVVLAATVTALSLPPIAAPFPAALFGVSFALKLVAAPIGLWLFLRRNPAARDLRPALDLPLRIVAVMAVAAAAHVVPQLPGLRAFPEAGLPAYVLACGLAMLMIHRNLLAQLLGLLVVSAGVACAGAIVAPGLPETMELGAAFDALIVTFIGLALVRAFVAHNPLLDVESLRSLRG